MKNINISTISNIDIIIKCIITVIILGFVLTLHYAMNTWTLKLKEINCECSKLWQRNYINILSIVVTIMFIINMGIFILNIKNSFPIIIYKSFKGVQFCMPKTRSFIF